MFGVSDMVLQWRQHLNTPSKWESLLMVVGVLKALPGFLTLYNGGRHREISLSKV